MAFGDVLAGYLEAAKAHQQSQLEAEQEQKKNYSGLLSKMADNPNLAPEQQSQLMQMSLEAAGSPFGQMPKWINSKTGEVSLPNVMVQPPAPPPVQTQGQPGDTGPLAGIMPAARTLTPPEGAPAPQAPPPQAGVNSQTLQAPTPPPQSRPATQPYSIEERLAHEAAANRMEFETKTAPTERLKLSKPMPTGNKGVEVDSDGNAFQVTQMRYLDPDTGKWQFVSQKSDFPLRKFAPRASGELNVEDALALQKQDPSLKFLDEGTGQSIDLEKIATTMPDATLRHTGSGQYQINSQKYNIGRFNNQVVPIPQVPPSGGPTAATVGQPLGTMIPPTTTTSTTLPSGVDATGNLVPSQSSTVRSRVTGPGGAAAAPTPPPNGSTAPAAAAPQAPVSPKAPVAPRPNISGAPPRMPSSQLTQQRAIAMPIREVAASLATDPANPGAPTLESLGKYATDPKARTDIGTAVNFILHSAASDKQSGTGGFLSDIPLAGDLLQWVRQHGVAQKMSEADIDAVQNVLKNPEYAKAVNQVIAAYGTIPGLRVATKGSAYQFYVKNLELELPTFGNVTSGGQYYQKLAILMRDVVNAGVGLNKAVSSPEEQQRYKDAETRFWKLSGLSDAELKTSDNDGGPNIRYYQGGVKKGLPTELNGPYQGKRIIVAQPTPPPGR